MTSGRASHRGGAKGDQRPGGTDELSAKMAAAALSDPQADRKRQMTERYSTPATVMRPDHVTMTEGTCSINPELNYKAVSQGFCTVLLNDKNHPEHWDVTYHKNVHL